MNGDTPIKTKTDSKPKPSRGRGRPRKTASNTEKVPQDFRSLLLDIKGEVSMVSEKQETCGEDLCILMDTKMNDFKESVGSELTTLKKDVKNSATLLTELQESQSVLNNKFEVLEGLKNDVTKTSNTLSKLEMSHTVMTKDIDDCKSKMISLEDKNCDIEINLIKQKRGVDQTSQVLSQQISDVEYGLAAHIETVKSNVEIEVAGAKQNQILLENKLANFSLEIQHQTDELNIKMRDLRGDFEQFKNVK